MHARLRVFWLVFSACFAFAVPPASEAGQNQRGRVEGRIVRSDGTPVEGATVLLAPATASTITDRNGRFEFDNVPAGTYSLAVSLGENSVSIQGVSVSPGAAVAHEETVDWEVGFKEALTVVTTSRRLERIIEAPASVTRLTAAEIEEKASHGQLPKLVEFAPGAQLTQGGIYDYNFNVRGFNSSLNRRVAVLIDGRNPAAAFFGAQEWAAVGYPLDDLASVEMARGPSAALYGANASSGVLNLITKDPRDSQGGLVRATFGQLGTANLDFRWARGLGSQWYAKVAGGLRHSGDFSVSRRGAAEYSVPCPQPQAGSINCLPQEAVFPARIDDNEVFFGSVRADKYFDNGMILAMEGGLADVAGPIIQTGVGRTQVTDSSRPWARFNLSVDRVNLLAAYTGRHAPGQLALSSGTNSTLTSHTFQFEGQTNRSLRQDRIHVVLGASAVFENVDSFDKGRQRQSLLFEPISSQQQALFGQADWQVVPSLKLVLGGRGDFSSLHKFKFSPKASAVYSIAPSHSVRLTYNEAFQVPNDSEFFLQADATGPANLTALNAFCAPFGVDCGFGITRVLAVGNEDLELEQIRTLEGGYKGLVGARALVSADYHRSRASNFITDLLPQLGTPLGRINPNFGPWNAPAGLPPAAAALVRAAAPPTLSNNIDGSNVLAVASYTNFGRVNTQGADFAVNYVFSPEWRGSLTYSWFDFQIENPQPGFESMVLPNSPEHTFSLGLGYSRSRLSADFGMRWVDGFRWAVGAFQGDVEPYSTADLTVNYRLTRVLKVGLNIANVFDDKHWETFGGDILRRRALVSLAYLW
jgi:outer membrane receptor for ferrienterochelin and colicins